MRRAPCFVSMGEWEKPPSLAPKPPEGGERGRGEDEGLDMVRT